MRVVLINAFWEFGSTGRNTIVKYNLLKELGHDARVFYGESEKKDTPSDVIYFGNRFVNFIHHCIAYFFGLAGSGSYITTRKLIKEIKKFRPDLIWLYNIHGYYLNEKMLFDFLKKSKIWVMYDMADEYPFLGKCCSSFECEKFKIKDGCGKCEHLQDYPRSRYIDNSKRKQQQKEEFYRGLDRITFRSARYVIEKANSSWLLRGREFFEIDTGIDNINIFYPRSDKELRRKYNVSDKTKVVLTCAPINDSLKGVVYLLEAAKLCEEEDVVFFNVSYGGDISLCPSNYIPVEYISDRNLMAEFYSMADVYVCPSLSDAQPNTCLEALSCGTPIIGFNLSGVPFVAPEGMGTYVTPKSSKDLADAIKKIKKKDNEIITKCREYSLKRYSIDVVNNNTKKYIDEMCNRAERDKKTYSY